MRSYPFVAMDTEFPGVVATPLGQFRSKEDFNYQQVSCTGKMHLTPFLCLIRSEKYFKVSCNVNMLKLIQVGFAILDKDGNLPPCGDVWQFNFQFSLNDDMYSQESVELLREAGIDFNRHAVNFLFLIRFYFNFSVSNQVIYAQSKQHWSDSYPLMR